MQIEIHNNIFLRTHRTNNAVADLWFFHGFGESGLSFKEVFSSSLAQHYNIFVPDFPGFGVSPVRGTPDDIQSSGETIKELIHKISGSRNFGIVCHSLAGLIGTWICQKYTKQALGFVSIEGNLTKSDCFFSGKTSGFDNAQEFYNYYIQEIIKMVGENSNDKALCRYLASVSSADAETMYKWGRSGVEATGNTQAGEDYASLACRTIYLWGDKSTPEQTRKFIHDNGLNNRCFKGSGHSPMIDASRECYEVIADFFDSSPFIL